MAQDEILEALNRGEAESRAEIEKLQAKIAKIRHMRIIHLGQEQFSLAASAKNGGRKAEQAKNPSKSRQIRDVVVPYLRSIERRANSGELLPLVVKAGVTFVGAGGKPHEHAQSKLSAFLANIEELDNVKGKGYGLVEWSQKSVRNGHASEHA